MLKVFPGAQNDQAFWVALGLGPPPPEPRPRPRLTFLEDFTDSDADGPQRRPGRTTLPTLPPPPGDLGRTQAHARLTTKL